MSGICEVAGKESAPATDFKNQPVAFANFGQQTHDSWSAGIGVVAESEMVYPSKVGLVVRLICHVRKAATLCRRSRR
jgi:hypothetical protein